MKSIKANKEHVKILRNALEGVMPAARCCAGVCCVTSMVDVAKFQTLQVNLNHQNFQIQQNCSLMVQAPK